MRNKGGAVLGGVILIFFFLVGAIGSRTEEMAVKAKEAGIRMNMVMLEGIFYSRVDSYSRDLNGVEELEETIMNDINSMENDKIINPLTNKDGCVEKTNLTEGGAVFYIKEKDNEQSGVNSVDFWPTTIGGAEAMIGYAIYIDEDTGSISMRIIPYDLKGKRINYMEKTIMG